MTNVFCWKQMFLKYTVHVLKAFNFCCDFLLCLDKPIITLVSVAVVLGFRPEIILQENLTNR